MHRRRHSTGTEWEGRIGFSRALRVGQTVHVSGTLGAGPDGRPAGDAYEQFLAAAARIRGALEALGASIEDVVRTRVYVVDLERNELDAARGHLEVFGSIMPASSLIGIAALVGTGFLVEVEADALVAD